MYQESMLFRIISSIFYSINLSLIPCELHNHALFLLDYVADGRK